jgi:multiple antibiotic resistance protein
MVIDPIGLVPIYLSLSSHIPQEKKKLIIRKAVLVSFIILTLFIVFGKWILSLLGIQPGAFFIAGGIMLFIISMEMLFGRPSKSRTADDNDEEGVSLAIFPLAIPLLAGPGVITTIILFTGGDPNPRVYLMLFISVIITLAVAWAVLSFSGLIHKVLGNTGVSVIERIMGLLLAGLSVQFIYDGIVKLGIIQSLSVP